MKILVTHINPHLDDISAIWLFKRFGSNFTEAKVEFIPAREGNKVRDKDDKIYLGVGRGKFDEHKGDLGECAASLVWKYLKREEKLDLEEAVEKGVDELVEWVRLGDTGQLKNESFADFSVASFIRVHQGGKYLDSAESTDLGFKILDRILMVLTNKQKALKEWQSVKEFETVWGKGYAVQSEYIDRTFCDKHSLSLKDPKDGALYLMFEPKRSALQFYTPKDWVDLEPLYKKLIQADPGAAWFLHHSHHMILCRSGASPDDAPTKLTFGQLIKAAEV